MSLYSYRRITTSFVTFFISWIFVWNVVNSETIICESDKDCHVICGSQCVNATIDGANANSLKVKCNSNKCDDLIIQCPSTDCSVKCSGSHSCDHINIKAQSTNSVSLSAFGEDAFYKSTLLAKKAESVNIKCTSDEYTACYDNAFHLPGSRTTFNCYGKGCVSLGDLYMSSARGLIFDINGCGVCAEWDHPTSNIDMESCISSFYIQCWMRYEVYFIGDCGWKHSKYDCDCDAMEWSFVDKPSDDECYSPDLTAGQIAGIVLGSIGGIICIICICVKIIAPNIQRQQKQAKKERDSMKKISECNKSETNTENKSETNTENRFGVRNKNNLLEIADGEKNNETKCGPLDVTKKKVANDRRKIVVHSGNKFVEIVFRDLNQLENIMYFQFIASIKPHFQLPNDCVLSLYEKVNGTNIDVDDMDDIIDSFEANLDDDSYVLHLYAIDLQNNGSGGECMDSIEGLQNMEQIRTDYEEMVIDENKDNEWIINTAPHMEKN